MSELSISEKRKLLKKIMKGEVRLEDLHKEQDYTVEMWVEDESDPEYLRMFHPENNKRIKKVDLNRRAILSGSMRVTLDIK
jgi:hypothetical protein